MNNKCLNLKKLELAQKFFWYHFFINYEEEKVNAYSNILSCFLLKNQAKDKILQVKNS